MRRVERPLLQLPQRRHLQRLFQQHNHPVNNPQDPRFNPDNSESEADQIDYRETADLTQVHGALRREHNEPSLGTVPVPLWLMTIFGVAVFSAGSYLTMFHGGFRGDVFNERDTSPKLLFAEQKQKDGGQAGPTADAAPVTVQGKNYYKQYCQSCHMENGGGTPGQIPPLAKSEWVNGSPKRLAFIVLKGVGGPIKVAGATYNSNMQAWEKTLTEKKIAAILTYIRQEWGNTGGEITPEQIASAKAEIKSRTEPWTEAELEQIPADADLEGGKTPGAPGDAAAQPKPETKS